MKFKVNDKVRWISKVHGIKEVEIAVCLDGNYAQYQIRIGDDKLAIVGEDELTLIANAPEPVVRCFEMCDECKQRLQEFKK